MKKTFKFDKLIRDRAYEMMRDAGVEMKLKENISEEEVVSYYKKKVLEEAQEVVDAKDREELVEEMADCLEIIKGLAKVLDIDFADIEKARREKIEKKGSFDNRIIVEDVSLERKGIFTKFYDYYIENSDKYPIIEKTE